MAVHPTTGREGVAFLFRHPLLPGLAPERQKRVVADAYAGMGWRVPELLQRVRESEDLYFDAVGRVRLDTWSRGRTTLVGDAAGCVSLFGEGSSMAIAGAVTLVQALVAQPHDSVAALERYERAHRTRLVRRQRGVAATSHLLVPATRIGLAVRDAAVRVWPVIDAARGGGA